MSWKYENDQTWTVLPTVSKTILVRDDHSVTFDITGFNSVRLTTTGQDRNAQFKVTIKNTDTGQEWVSGTESVTVQRAD